MTMIQDNKAETIVGSCLLQQPVTAQMVDDILCTAFYGGISYWCHTVYPENRDYEGIEYTSESLTAGKNIVFVTDEPLAVDVEDEEKTEWLMTMPRFLEGMRRECMRSGMTVEAMYDNHDADTADNIVQYALFGELIYG